MTNPLKSNLFASNNSKTISGDVLVRDKTVNLIINQVTHSKQLDNALMSADRAELQPDRVS